MISVVMATYNGEKYILEQLNSIWNQTIRPDEIVISDDCSKDSTVQIIEYFKRKTGAPVHLFVNSVRLGYIDNFKYAFGHVTGEYIFLCDQDDIWMNNKIEYMFNLFQANAEIKALCSNYYFIDSKGELIRKYEVPHILKIRKISWESFLRHPKYPGMSMAFRKELLYEQELKCNNNIPHDWVINELAAAEGGLFFTNAKLSKYRQHGENTVGVVWKQISSERREKREKNMVGILEGLNSLSKESRDPQYLTKIISFQEKRYNYFKKKKKVFLFLLEILNIKYISIRTILGDLYTNLR